MAVIYDNAPLKTRIKKSLANEFKHEAIKTAQNVISGKRDTLVDEAEGWEEFRASAARIRDHVIKNLDYYVKQFAESAERAGCTVHFAPTATDAVEEILDIFEQLGETSCVKAKSMMTEEIGLNDYLAEHGVQAIETDCAEHILQTAGDAPSHIVVPALHFDRAKIRDLYRDKLGYEGTDDPEEITRFLRATLRPQFMAARVGVTGCNFAVAETGTCTLVTNEGNARMVSSLPETQIVVVGVERIVPDLQSLDVMMELLVRSAVGAKITSSFTLSTGARKTGEADGPKAVHIVLVDNGRSAIAGGDYASVLRCIRCGACMNTCPVYRHITGHGYGSIYPGPIGVALTPLLEGYEATEKMPYACTLCGACSSVCPVRIPLNSLILHHRNDMVDRGFVSSAEKAAFGVAGKVLSNRTLYGLATGVGAPGMKLLGEKTGRVGSSSAWVPVLKGWTGSRDMDLLAKKKFRTLFAEHERGREADRYYTYQEPGRNAAHGDAQAETPQARIEAEAPEAKESAR